jgi:hypothetical protein
MFARALDVFAYAVAAGMFHGEDLAWSVALPRGFDSHPNRQSIAQWVEQRTDNSSVVGSNPIRNAEKQMQYRLTYQRFFDAKETLMSARMAQGCRRRTMRPIRFCEQWSHRRMGWPGGIAQRCPIGDLRARPRPP